MASEDSKASASPLKAVEFLKDCRSELDKVSKPSRQETMQATMITIVIMFVVAVALALFDMVFSNLTRVVL